MPDHPLQFMFWPCFICGFYAPYEGSDDDDTHISSKYSRLPAGVPFPGHDVVNDPMYICMEVQILRLPIHHIARLITEYLTAGPVCMGCWSTNESDHAWNGKFGYNKRYVLCENGVLDAGTWMYFRNGRWWRGGLRQFNRHISTRKKRASRRCLNQKAELDIGYSPMSPRYGVKIGQYICDLRKDWWTRRPEPHWVTRYRKKTGVTYPYLLIDEVVPELYRRIRKKCMLMRVEHAFKVFRSLLVS